MLPEAELFVVGLVCEELAIFTDPMYQVIINVLVNSASTEQVQYLLDPGLPHHLLCPPGNVADPHDFAKDAYCIVHIAEFTAETFNLRMHQIDQKNRTGALNELVQHRVGVVTLNMMAKVQNGRIVPEQVVFERCLQREVQREEHETLVLLQGMINHIDEVLQLRQSGQIKEVKKYGFE